MKVAPQSRVRTAVLYRLVELACRKNHTGNAGSCGSARASVELNLSDVALALGCTVRIVRYWLAHLCKRGIVRRIDARGGRGRGLELEINVASLRARLAAERRNSEIPLSPFREKKRSGSSEHVACHSAMLREARRHSVRAAAVALRASPVREQQIPRAARGTRGTGIAISQPASASRPPTPRELRFFERQEAKVLGALGETVGFTRIGRLLGASMGQGAAVIGRFVGGERAAAAPLAGQKEGLPRARTAGPIPFATAVRDAAACESLFRRPDVIQDGRGAQRRVPLRQCTHGKCGARCRYLMSSDEIANTNR